MGITLLVLYCFPVSLRKRSDETMIRSAVDKPYTPTTSDAFKIKPLMIYRHTKAKYLDITIFPAASHFTI
jgi:hypothetical protein